MGGSLVQGEGTTVSGQIGGDGFVARGDSFEGREEDGTIHWFPRK